MKKFLIPERNQLMLMTNVSLDSVAPVGSAVRSINDLVDELNTLEIEKEYDLFTETGRKPIHPKTILKVALYAMHNCRFSLRKMEHDTEFNLTYRWITGNTVIDHSTLGKFLSKFRGSISDLFTQVVIVSVENDLVDFKVLGTDTVKIRANASYKKDRNLSGIEKAEKKIRKRIEELLEDVEKENLTEERRILEDKKLKLKTARQVLKERIAKKSVTRTEKEKEKIQKNEKINLTDFDAHKMQQANGEINPAYSTTLTTDSKADIITHFQVNESDNDNEALLPAVEGSIQRTGEKHEIVDADSGFFSFDNAEKLNNMNQFALIPDKRYDVDINQNQKNPEFDRVNFTYVSDEDLYICPCDHELKRTTDFNIAGESYSRYANAVACDECPRLKECSRGKHRTISRAARENLKEEMRERLSADENKETYKKRAHVSESPFGNIKHNLKYRIFMRRGQDKVQMEMGLLCILHNILKIAPVRYQFGI